MRWSILVCVFTLTLVGCQRVFVKIPAATNVASIEIRAKDYGRGELPDVTLTKPADIREVIAWLNEVDWSTQGRSTRAMGIAAIGDMILTMKDGSTMHFTITPDGIIAGEWLRPADTKKLEDILKKHRA